MLDIKLIREKTRVVRADLKKRGDEERMKMLEELIEKDKQWRKLLQETEKLKHDRNIISEEIAKLKKGHRPVDDKLKKASEIANKIKENEKTILELRNRCHKLHMSIPNILHKSVPVGKDEHDNKEVRRWGEAPKFGFEPKDHVTLATNLGIIDRDRANKVAGHGFFYLKGKLAILDYAILKFAMDYMTKKGYTLIEPPFMLKRNPYEGVVDLGDFEDVLYKIEGEDLHLIATSEHAMAAMYMDETLNLKDLPIKICGISPCFRKEVGTHGKYTKGLYRMHQFNKIEQFIFCHPDDSWKFLRELQKNAEHLYRKLGLHYRVVDICTGDIGTIAAKKYDIEVWMADGKFREIGSNSNCTDYQARRLNIKFREKEGAPAVGHVHTLNNTAIATSRVMLAILEQNQQADGSIKIPKVLHKYCGFKEITKA